MRISNYNETNDWKKQQNIRSNQNNKVGFTKMLSADSILLTMNQMDKNINCMWYESKWDWKKDMIVKWDWLLL